MKQKSELCSGKSAASPIFIIASLRTLICQELFCWFCFVLFLTLGWLDYSLVFCTSVFHPGYPVCLNLLMTKNEETSVSRYARLFCSLHFHQNSSGLNGIFLGQLQEEFR